MANTKVRKQSPFDAALKKENLRLQRKIAKLEAQNISLRHGIIAREEYKNYSDSAATKKAATDAAKRRARANYDEPDA
jgi:hypothetical protein